jgi:hypothetical protein
MCAASQARAMAACQHRVCTECIEYSRRSEYHTAEGAAAAVATGGVRDADVRQALDREPASERTEQSIVEHGVQPSSRPDGAVLSLS